MNIYIYIVFKTILTPQYHLYPVCYNLLHMCANCQTIPSFLKTSNKLKPLHNCYTCTITTTTLKSIQTTHSPNITKSINNSQVIHTKTSLIHNLSWPYPHVIHRPQHITLHIAYLIPCHRLTIYQPYINKTTYIHYTNLHNTTIAYKYLLTLQRIT